MSTSSSYVYIESCISGMLLDSKKDISQMSLSTMKKNRAILRQITTFVAELNAEYYNEILQEQLKPALFNFIHKSNSPLEDEWGRVTFFYTMIGPHVVLLYQPGTPTFISSVDGNCDLMVCHDNCQQNGTVLGRGCACFLAKFMANLSQQYQYICAQETLCSNNFHPSLYGKALDTCLKNFAAEDADAHGRLLEIKDLLLHVGGQKEIKCESLHLFYLKDIAVDQDSNDDYDRIVRSRLRLTETDFDRLITRREQYRSYKRLDDYFETTATSNSYPYNQDGSDFINSELWKIIRHGILNKNNIFKDQHLARSWLKITFEGFEKSMKNSVPNESPVLRVESKDLERSYKLEKNEKLMEYYVQLQLGMESLFRSAIIADADIFELRTPNICIILDIVADLIPEVNLIIKSKFVLINIVSF